MSIKDVDIAKDVNIVDDREEKEAVISGGGEDASWEKQFMLVQAPVSTILPPRSFKTNGFSMEKFGEYAEDVNGNFASAVNDSVSLNVPKFIILMVKKDEKPTLPKQETSSKVTHIKCNSRYSSEEQFYQD